MLTNEHKKFFKQILEQKLNHLISEKSQFLEDEIISMDKLPDFIDQASHELERNTRILLREREADMIFKIKEALGKLNEGKYGICEDCRKEISVKRLEIQPEARLCIFYKRMQEFVRTSEN